MFDPTKIPESTYNELVELMGREKAELFIEGEFYNYGAVSSKIAKLRIKNFMKSQPAQAILLGILVIALLLLWYL